MAIDYLRLLISSQSGLQRMETDKEAREESTDVDLIVEKEKDGICIKLPHLHYIPVISVAVAKEVIVHVPWVFST